MVWMYINRDIALFYKAQEQTSARQQVRRGVHILQTYKIFVKFMTL